eukprot:scaffold14900_cov59-Phaeocystis_antarctica.AAC.2
MGRLASASSGESDCTDTRWSRKASVTTEPHTLSGGRAKVMFTPRSAAAHPYLCIRFGVGLSSSRRQPSGSLGLRVTGRSTAFG